MKKPFALLLAAVLFFSFLPLHAEATDEKLIAITYDDGPSPYTAQLLTGLSELGAKATFFIIGYQAQARPEIVKRAWMEGHQIANHTWDHPWLTKLSWSGVQSQVSRTDTMLDSAIGFDQDYMLRPPYGDYNQSVLQAAGVPSVFWSMNTSDYTTSNASVVCDQILRTARDGAICCIHDTHLSTVQGSLQAIGILQQQGYQFVTVEELLYRRGITPQNGVLYYSAYPGTTADSLAQPFISVSDEMTRKQITITGDSRARIYYTLDGSQPTPINSFLYTGPFTVTYPCTICAVSVVKWNGLRTAPVTYKADNFYCTAPTLTLEEGGVIRMVSPTPKATIHYTSDNSPASSAGPIYNAVNPPAAIRGTTYRALTTSTGFYPSGESILTYSDRGCLMRDVTVSDWYYAVIDLAVSEGILNGVGDERMAPNDPLTRAMLVTLLYRLDRPGGSFPAAAFSDTESAEYYAAPLNWAVSEGIVAGYPDGSFRPHQSITREELCLMLERWLLTHSQSFGDADSLAAFTDADAIDDWARDGVNAICGLGVMQGYPDQTIRPQATATRAEALTMLLRAEDQLEPVPESSEVQPD